MSNVLETLGLSTEEVNNTGTAEVQEAYKPLPSGIYTAKLVSVGSFVSKEGAVMLKVETEVDDREVTEYVNIKKKDGKSNEIGVRFLKMLADAAKLKLEEIETQNIKEKCYGKEVDYTKFVTFTGKEVNLFIRETFEEGAKYEQGNEIEFIADTENKNGAGEDQSETFLEKIEKKPILQKRSSKKKPSTTEGKATAEKAAAVL
jgi:hypothetical protein